MASNCISSVKELITCSICHKCFDDPRILPCSHIYCRKCMEQIASANEDQFECPAHDGTLVTKNNVNTLPVHQIMLKLIQLYDSMQSLKQCTNCDYAIAKYACNRCENERFCSKCYQGVHMLRIMQKHQQIPIHDRSSITTSCETHPDEKFRFWCRKCNAVICLHCILFQHKDHDYVLMKEVAEETEIKIHNELKSIQKSLDSRINRVHVLTTEVDNDMDSNIKMVKETMSSLRHMIDDREKTMIQEIIDIETKQKKQIENCKTPLGNQLQCLNLRKAMLDMLLITKDHTKLLKAKEEFDNYLEKTNETLQSLQIPTRIIYHSQGLNQLQQFQEEILQHGQYVERNNPELEKLMKDTGTSDTLYVQNKHLSYQDMKVVADVLRKTPALTHLYLIQNEIGDQGMKDLADALMKNKTLTNLFVQQNRISPEAQQQARETLQMNTKLTVHW
ncbi:unnamed protein product [Adineta steineri]|uniref:Uncharacterized protein n=1 Tax=Adineta steineri TaxID=433720 RepID=A0A819U535_9BILA|nr:unnamed protein product [Adineta steineri]CAF4089210.1 unnamed protein product [Adineta steineri]